MKIIISPWPSLATYFTILAADIPQRKEGQIGSINLNASPLEAQYYQAFYDQDTETRKAIERQVNEFITEQLKLRAITKRLLS